MTTSKLNEDRLWDLSLSEPDIAYLAVPKRNTSSVPALTWRIRLEPTFSASQRLGLDINGEVVLGREGDAQDTVSLKDYDADQLGVSRRHAMLRPTDTKLYIFDLGSTNGTSLNGRSIGVNTPYSLSNGDLLSLGKLEFIVRIIKRPAGQTMEVPSKADLADSLLPIARAITSHLTIEDVLKQALETTISYTGVDEASVWLVDEKTGELFLEADRGIADEQIRHMRLSVADTLAGKVIATGKPVHANRAAGGHQIKVKTGYLVDAVIYVPLTLGGVTFGVLSASHRSTGKAFGAYDEKIMTAIGDLTAVAVQNARVYEATNHALMVRSKVVTLLNYTLSYDFKKLLNSSIGHAGLLKSYLALDDENAEIIENILSAGDNMARLVERLIETTALSELSAFHFIQCDLVEVAARAIEDSQVLALPKAIELEFQVMGDGYPILGDEIFLYRSILNLLDNAVRFSPRSTRVTLTLVFSPHDVIIRVRDAGPGIPEDRLPELFDKYYRSQSDAGGHDGLGLGLELVRATVEAHRGTIVARNMEQRGAEFIVTLPNTLATK
jgi:K+-sensing histidine kinase KdpD